MNDRLDRLVDEARALSTRLHDRDVHLARQGVEWGAYRKRLQGLHACAESRVTRRTLDARRAGSTR